MKEEHQRNARRLNCTMCTCGILYKGIENEGAREVEIEAHRKNNPSAFVICPWKNEAHSLVKNTKYAMEEESIDITTKTLLSTSALEEHEKAIKQKEEEWAKQQAESSEKEKQNAKSCDEQESNKSFFTQPESHESQPESTRSKPREREENIPYDECPLRLALRDAEELTGPDLKDKSRGDNKRFLSDRERYDGDGHNHVGQNLNLKTGEDPSKKRGHGNKRFKKRDPQEEQRAEEREREKEEQQEANYSSDKEQPDSDRAWWTTVKPYQPTEDDPSSSERSNRKRESSLSSTDLYTQTDERTARDHDTQINKRYAQRIRAQLVSYRNRTVPEKQEKGQNAKEWERRLRTSRGRNEQRYPPQNTEQKEKGKRKMCIRRRVEPDSDEETNRGTRRARHNERLYYVEPLQTEQLQAECDEEDSDGDQVHFNRADHRNPKVKLRSREEAEARRSERR